MRVEINDQKAKQKTRICFFLENTNEINLVKSPIKKLKEIQIAYIRNFRKGEYPYRSYG